MHKKKWVRVGLAAVIASGALGVLSAVGCSGDDNTSPSGSDSGTKQDSSITGDTGTSTDTGTSATDSSSNADVEASTPLPNAKVYLVNATADTNAPPFRFCFGVGNPEAGAVTVAGSIPPFPDSKIGAFPIPGLFAGFGGSVASSPKLASFDLSTITISLYAVDATQIENDTADGGPDGGAEVPCEGLIGTDALGKAGTGGGTLTQGTQYWYLGTITSGTLAHGTSWVAAIAGCAPGETGQAAELCNSSKLPTYSSTTGNLTLIPFKLDTTTAVTGDAGIGAQFANASPSWDVESALAAAAADAGTTATASGFWSLTQTVSDGGTDAATDGGDAAAPAPTFNFFPVSSTGPFGTISTPLVSVASVPLNVPNAGFAIAIAGAGGLLTYPAGCTPGTSCLSPFPYTLPLIDELTNGATVTNGVVTTPAGGDYAYGQGYAFILLGDPSQPAIVDDAFNGKSAHFLAFPVANP